MTAEKSNIEDAGDFLEILKKILVVFRLMRYHLLPMLWA